MISEKIARELMCDCGLHETWHEQILNKWKNEGIVSDGANKLQYYRDTTVGLWATDKPEIIPESVKDKFFRLE